MSRVVLSLMFVFAATASAGDFRKPIDAILAVGPLAEGQDDAAAAVQTLSAAGGDALVPILSAIGEGGGVADNWLRGAYEAAAENAEPVPVDDLAAFFADTSHNDRARRLAYETVLRVDADRAATLAADALNDSSPEMRRDAVAALIDAAEEDGADRVTILRRALDAATERSQVDDVAAKLKSAGETVELGDKYGFVRTWSVVGPFDNPDEAGFDVKTGPEANGFDAVDRAATFETTVPDVASPVTWQTFSTDAENGLLDIANDLGPYKGAMVYAAADVASAEAQPVEVRISTANAWKLWLNGELLFEREEYHRGRHWDQYTFPARLRAGVNTVVLKLLQNEQDQGWAQEFSFSLRLTDPAGRAAETSQP